MIHLLDVNVLIALLDVRHVAHEAAHDWFGQWSKQGWATCPITQNGFLRIAGAKYYAPNPLPVSQLSEMLGRFCSQPDHRFWSEDFSLLDSARVNHGQITSTAQITDTYLLALAVRNRGRLATFDRRLSVRAVEGGEEALLIIPTRTGPA